MHLQEQRVSFSQTWSFSFSQKQVWYYSSLLTRRIISHLQEQRVSFFTKVKYRIILFFLLIKKNNITLTRTKSFIFHKSEVSYNILLVSKTILSLQKRRITFFTNTCHCIILFFLLIKNNIILFFIDNKYFYYQEDV